MRGIKTARSLLGLVAPYPCAFFIWMDFFYFLPLWFLFGWIFLEVPGTAFIWMSFLKSVPVRFSFLLRFKGLEYDIRNIHLINL